MERALRTLGVQIVKSGMVLTLVVDVDGAELGSVLNFGAVDERGCDLHSLGGHLGSVLVSSGRLRSTLLRAAGPFLFVQIANFESALAAVGGSSPCKLCLLYTSPSPRDQRGSRMPSSA